MVGSQHSAFAAASAQTNQPTRAVGQGLAGVVHAVVIQLVSRVSVYCPVVGQ